MTAQFRRMAARGRSIVCLGAVILVGSTLLQWWQVGGGPGELPTWTDRGISDGRVLLMFLAAAACLLLVTLRLASERPVPIDHPYTYLGLFAAALIGFGLRAVDLAQQGLLPWPPVRGWGLWLAGAGLVVLACGVAAIFGERRRESAGGGSVPYADTVARPAVEPAGEHAAVEPAAEPAVEPEWPEAGDPSTQPRYVPAWLMGAWRRLDRPPAQPDRSASLDSEPRGRLDRKDIWVVAALIVVILSMRVYGLGQPTQMYFDEVYHARTATEFLQDWRYNIPHDIFEWTHPHLAKYAIAGGITLFSDDKVTSTGRLDVPVEAAVIQERTATSPGSATPVDPNAEVTYQTDYGDRVFVATGSEVRAYDLGSRALAYVYSIPGASALSDPTAAGLIYVGTSAGYIYSIDTNSLDDLRAGTSASVKPAVRLSVATGLSITHVFSGSPPYVLVADASGNIVSIDLSVGGGEIAGRGLVPGAADFASFGATDSSGQVLVAYRDGVGLLDAHDVVINSSVSTDSAATSIAFNPNAIQQDQYRYYVTAGDSLLLLGMNTSGTPAALSLEGDQPLKKMPGEVTKVVFDEATKIAQVLGRTPDGTGWTVYAVETNGNAVFSDARLPFEPVAIGIDNAVQVRAIEDVIQMPNVNREALLAFAPDGSTASTDVGQFAFSWRIVGVLFGTVMAVCLYLLARILFRRRSVGLLVAFFSLVDGMLFAQSRIAMNDAYVGGFLLLAYLIFAVIWLKVWQNRLVFWLGMPLLGVVLGLALASKWVALYAIASVGVLILIRSALGRLVTILALAAGTGVLGWMALAEMQYAPDTGNVPLALLLLTLAAIVAAAGILWAARTRLTPDRVFVGAATAVVSGVLLACALVVSPGSLDNGAPNYTFFVIMLAITCLAAAANAYRPVAWTRDELYFAMAAPPVIGFVGPFVLALLFVPFGFPFSFPPLLRVALEAGAAGLAVGIAAGAAFRVAGRIGFGPLAAQPRAGSPASMVEPPAPPPDGWLRLGSGFGVPAAWTAFCVAILPFLVYIVLYIPWSMPWQPQTVATGPEPAIACWSADARTGACLDAWPAGHTGQTLWDLTVAMYGYHNDLRASHPASSPWWAWPLDLKPVWFDSGGDVPGMFSWIHDGGNPALWWMAIVGVAFISWQAFKRRNLGLGLVAMAFFWQWLSWSRIDRAAFQYHFYTALPFFLLALAYFLAELWHGPSRRTWLLARVGGAAALLTPGLLWLLKPELCGLARVDTTEYFQNAVCGTGTGDVVITTRVFLIAVVLVASLAAMTLALWRLERGQGEGPRNRGRMLQFIVPAGIAFLLIQWLGAAGPNDVLIREALPADSLTFIPVTLGVVGSYFALTARNPRRFVLGVCAIAAVVFVFMYPDVSALWLPNTIQGIYAVTSPTWMYGFEFATNLQASPAVKVISAGSVVATLAALVVAGTAAWAAGERRLAVGRRRTGLSGPVDGPEATPPDSVR